MHAGWEQTLASIREKFWIVRALAKDVVRNCLVCRHQNKRAFRRKTAVLPAARVARYNPLFAFTGVDLFGLMPVNNGCSTPKQWALCSHSLTMRAIFLEPVQLLETGNNFLLTLCIFISELPRQIRLNQGTNFIIC